jgi:hypothetical protein
MHEGHRDHGHPFGGGLGHNGHRAPVQWQTPHRPDHARAPEAPSGERDLDLVEKAFLDAFPRAPDPTSFLRLAGVPFVGKAADGRTLSLLRVEASQTTDIGSLSPALGGGHRYDPLPAKMASRRERLALIYFDGREPVSLDLAAARALENVTPAV